MCKNTYDIYQSYHSTFLNACKLFQTCRGPHQGCDRTVHLAEVRDRHGRRRRERPGVALEARQRLRPEVAGDGEGAQEGRSQRRSHEGRGGDHDGEQGRHLHHLGVAKVGKYSYVIPQVRVEFLYKR